jgi:glycosyltransferase involved in cell wall biosynthesis
MKKTILHLTPFYSPNIGGVETHLHDLIGQLDFLGYHNLVLTYSPITTPNTSYKTHQNFSHTKIRRFPWYGHNLFHQLEKHPLLNFLYITPYLFLRSFFYLLIHHPKIDTIHSHGLNAAVIGIILKKIFHIKCHIVSLYSTYDNVDPNLDTSRLMVNILNHTDQVLTQSQQSISQFKNMGVNHIHRYRHWLNLNRFKPGLKNKQITALFVGRMIPQKGAFLLAKVAQKMPHLQFNFIGTGPDFLKIKKLKVKNVKLLGNIPYRKLHSFYQSSHLLIVPSLYQEGWGRVAMEAIASGTPVIASKKGALSELLNSSVAILVNPTQANLEKALKQFFQNKNFYQKIQKNCRPFALKNFSAKNIKLITKYY